jgi:hypothetical protein
LVNEAAPGPVASHPADDQGRREIEEEKRMKKKQTGRKRESYFDLQREANLPLHELATYVA